MGKWLPGAGYQQQRMAIQDLEAMPGKYIKTEPSEPLWKQFKAQLKAIRVSGAPVPAVSLTGTAATVTEIGDDLSTLVAGLKNAGEERLAASIGQLSTFSRTSPLAGAPRPVSIDVLQNNMSRLREATGRLTDPLAKRTATRLYEAMGGDVDAAASMGMPEAKLLQRAKNAYHKEMVREDLRKDIVKRGIQVEPKNPQGEFTTTGSLTATYKHPGTPGEIAQVERVLQVMKPAELQSMLKEIEHIGSTYRQLPGQSMMEWKRRIPALMSGGALGYMMGGEARAKYGGLAVLGGEDSWSSSREPRPVVGF
jgi:hypothetical protein